MWLLLLVLFSGPMQIERVEILQTHWDEKQCVRMANQVKKNDLPDNANIGCVYVGTIKKT
jgi:hypothetical protein|tara:strand:- start:1907 stop:2086 length:180 start_codon:yes stop_codon:yes gene_type:complete